MGNILTDVVTAVRLTREARKTEGAEVCAVRKIPVMRLSYWGATMEFCLCNKEMNEAVRHVFYALPEEVQHSLVYAPTTPGGWVERAQFWKEHLKPVLPQKMYHTVIIKFIGWYARCVRQRSMEASV